MYKMYTYAIFVMCSKKTNHICHSTNAIQSNITNTLYTLFMPCVFEQRGGTLELFVVV